MPVGLQSAGQPLRGVDITSLLSAGMQLMCLLFLGYCNPFKQMFFVVILLMIHKAMAATVMDSEVANTKAAVMYQ
jgi:hypothetical protein